MAVGEFERMKQNLEVHTHKHKHKKKAQDASKQAQAKAAKQEAELQAKLRLEQETKRKKQREEAQRLVAEEERIRMKRELEAAKAKAAEEERKRKELEEETAHSDQATYEEEEDEKVAENEMPMTSFKAELNQLLHVIESHMQFMKTHEKNVNKIIASSGVHVDLLKTAKATALSTEKEILNQIMNISTMNQFLNDIILVENLFNSQYTADQRDKQRIARQQYASSISTYESKPKQCSKEDSFVDLV
eukprot:240496_1